MLCSCCCNFYLGGSNTLIQSEAYQNLYETWRGPITNEKVALASEKLAKHEERLNEQWENADDGIYTPSLEERAKSSFFRSVVWKGGNLEAFNERKSSLTIELEDLNKNSYEYKETLKHVTMLNDLEQPFGFYNTSTWETTVDFINTLGFIIFSGMILVGLAPVFADEHAKKMTGFILSTKHGKRKIVTAKLFASLVFIVTIFIVLHISNVLLMRKTFGPFVDGTVPLQNIFMYVLSRFSWEIWEYFFIGLSVQLFAGIALGILVLFMSIITRSSMLAFFISGVIFGTPFLFRLLGFEQPFIQYIIQFSFAELMRVKGLFDQFIAFNVFGYPVLYPIMLVVIFTFITFILILLTYHFFKKQEIRN